MAGRTSAVFTEYELDERCIGTGHTRAVNFGNATLVRKFDFRDGCTIGGTSAVSYSSIFAITTA